MTTLDPSTLVDNLRDRVRSQPFWQVPGSMGANRTEIATVAARSPHYRDSKFHNTEPSRQLNVKDADAVTFRQLLHRGDLGRPGNPIPLVHTPPPREAADLAVSWFGHSSVLIEVDGHRVIADPVWAQRCSPSGIVGPARMHPAPIALTDLPPIDAVIISHDHYDHLDYATVIAFAELQSSVFVVPLGIGAHLRLWGIAPSRIVELDWDEDVQVGELTLTCTEARHFSGRGLARDLTQWASWSIAGPTKKVFFGGDTGYTPRFQRIAELYGPFDLTLLPVGAYNKAWPDIHMNPEEAVTAHGDVARAGALFVPIHWATFNLALHPWSEPIVRLLDAAGERSIPVAVPRPGERVVGSAAPSGDPWWQAVSGS